MPKKMILSDIDMVKYKSQTNVRRSMSHSNMAYDNVAIMTDADVDG